MGIVWDNEKTQTIPQKKIKWDDEIDAKPTEEKPNIIKNALIELQKPGAVIRAPIQNILKKISGIQGSITHQQAVEQPQNVPLFEDLFPELTGQQGQDQRGDFVKNLISAATPVGIPGTLSGVGKMLDVATDPTQILPMLLGLKNPKLISKTGEVTENIGKRLTPNFIKRPFRKFQTKYQKGELFTPETTLVKEQMGKLKSISEGKYTPQIQAEQEKIAGLKPKYTKVEKLAKERYGGQIDIEKQNLKKSLDEVSNKMEQSLGKIKSEGEVATQKTSLEFKNRFGKFTRENSKNYGIYRDKIVEKLSKEGRGITRGQFKEILQNAKNEIDSEFLNTGQVGSRFRKMAQKYGVGISEETSPELAALQEKFGVDLSSIANIQETGWKGLGGKNANQILDLKQVLKDVKSVTTSLSEKAKGGLRTFSEDDIVGAILDKHFGNYLGKEMPEFTKLQSRYAPIIEQMKAGRKLFKPGAPYEISEKSISALKKPDIAEKQLLSELEKGTPGFSKGMGELSKVPERYTQKIVEIEKGGEIAKGRITKTSEIRQQELSDMLANKILKIEERSAKQTKLSEVKQTELADALKKRIFQIEKRKGFGQKEAVDISKLAQKKTQGEKIKKIAALGGVATTAGYYGRRLLYKLLFGR